MAAGDHYTHAAFPAAPLLDWASSRLLNTINASVINNAIAVTRFAFVQLADDA
ncbi:MAG: hypothetical protein OZSIB_4100 [Candidatus Ozemobacter sibiricus]|uniref:Uncharacterized protein n=1 Tax=Candidatus Ozemobacter sibiricus TaxID=2268124 RepID=A0A367ZNC2_9BACT|nr:MAG: hypothetical protein OZSIB_4100 [Candidatus Ozemobacter sibiricus]